MKKYICCFLVAILISCFCLAVQAEQQMKKEEIPDIPEGYAFYRYQYAFLDISLIYPENWINYSTQERGIMIYTPDSKGTLLLRAIPLFGEEYTLDELWSENMDNLKLAGADVLNSFQDTLSGYPAIRTLYAIKIGKDVHKYICYYSIIEDLFYSFSFNTKEIEFEKYLSDVKIIVHSIKINK